MGEKLRPEERNPPSKETRELIRGHIGKRWPGANVEVLYAWTNGLVRLYFKWRGDHHEQVSARFPAMEPRVCSLMSYQAVVDEIALLRCDMCEGEGVLLCTRCKGSGHTKTGRTCTRCNGKASKTCPRCVRSVK